jgi:precorrin-6B methylase 2
VSDAATRWSEALSQWGIPQEILDQATESPWIHPPVMFEVPDHIQMTESHLRAGDPMRKGDSVLDIGCGGGIAAFAVVPPAELIIGVDHQPEMLTMFRKNAFKKNVQCKTVEGFWPAVADQTPIADVVVCHHVVYNVSDIVPFLSALNSHAKKRVVIEMPTTHPASKAASAWKHFWNIDRPTSPTHLDLLEVLREMGIDAHLELWEGEMRSAINVEQEAHFLRIRLCLPPAREGEVLAYVKNSAVVVASELATIWWDVKN